MTIALLCRSTDGALSWGTYLGADWKAGEGEACFGRSGLDHPAQFELFAFATPTRSYMLNILLSSYHESIGLIREYEEQFVSIH